MCSLGRERGGERRGRAEGGDLSVGGKKFGKRDRIIDKGSARENICPYVRLCLQVSQTVHVFVCLHACMCVGVCVYVCVCVCVCVHVCVCLHFI